MSRRLPVGLVAVVCLAAMAWAAPADAQRRRPGRYIRPIRPMVSIGAYYGPYFYNPWYYSSFWLHPPYAYGYPYYHLGPAGAGVRVQVEPKIAEVYVDGNLAGIVDQFDGFFQTLRVEPGGREITIYLEGYRTLRQRLYLSPGSTYKIRGTLERLAPGEPNEPRPQPAPEPPDVQLRDQEPPENVAPMGPPPERRPREALPPMPGDSRFGQVAIRVQPADADVLIDGEPWRGPQGSDRLVVHLSAGTHRIEIRKEGFDPFVTAVEIKRGEVAVLNVSLAKL